MTTLLALAHTLESDTTVKVLVVRNLSCDITGACTWAEAGGKKQVVGMKIDTEGAKALARALKRHKTLGRLSLIGGCGGDYGAIFLASCLKVNTTVVDFELLFCGIREETASCLADALQTNRTLSRLSLCWNPIGASGAIAFSSALKQNNTLTWLCLANCDIGREGARSLADGLKANSTLLQLNVDSNNIDGDGGIALANALQENHSLKHLLLNDNRIGNEGAAAFAAALKTNRTLTNLHVASNDIGETGGQAICKAITATSYNTPFNFTLVRLAIENNNLRQDLCRDIEDAIKVNRKLAVIFTPAVPSVPNAAMTLDVPPALVRQERKPLGAETNLPPRHPVLQDGDVNIDDGTNSLCSLLSCREPAAKTPRHSLDSFAEQPLPVSQSRSTVRLSSVVQSNRSGDNGGQLIGGTPAVLTTVQDALTAHASSSVSNEGQLSWTDLNERFPWGTYLSDGTFKNVYEVYNSRDGRYEAISVM
jgi:Leucine Rich repeat